MTGNSSLLQQLYDALFPSGWEPAPVSLDSPNVPAAITGLFKSLLGGSADSLTVDGIAAKPPAPGDSLVFSGTTVSLFAGNSVSVTATFTEVTSPTPALVLKLVMSPSGSVTLDGLLTAYGIIPSSLTDGYTYPSMTLPGVTFTFDSQAPSLAVVTGGTANPLLSDFPSIKSILPADLTAGIDITVDPSTGLRNFAVELSGNITLGSTHTVSVGIPLGLSTAWQLQVRPASGGGTGFDLSKLDIGPFSDAIGDITGLMPSSVTKKIQLQYLGITFFLKPSPSIYSASIIVATTEPWNIVTNVFSATSLALYVNVQKKFSGSGYDYHIKFQGQAHIGAPGDQGFNVQVKATLSPGADTITFTARDITVEKIWNTLETAFDVDIDMFPPGVSSLATALVLEYMQVDMTVSGGSGTLQGTAFTVTYEDQLKPPWFHNVYLDSGASVSMALQRNNTTKKQELARASVEGTMVFGPVTVGVALTRPSASVGWGLSVTSEKVVLPSISDLASFAGGGTLENLLPAGVRNTGNFVIFDLNIDVHLARPYLQNLSFTLSYSDTSPPWVLIPRYFSVDDVTVIAHITPQPSGTDVFTGYVSGIVTIAGVGVSLAAQKDAATDPWTFTGKTMSSITVELQDIATDFGIPSALVSALPASLTVESLDVTAVPSTGAFSTDVTITMGTDWPFESLQLSDVSFDISRTKEHVDAQISGNIVLGSGQGAPTLDLTADYDSTGGWTFSGGLAAADSLKASDLLSEFLPDLPFPDLTVNRLNFTGQPSTKSYTFSLACDWSIDLEGLDLGDLDVTASANLVYDAKNSPAYTGSTIEGTLDFHGLSLSAGLTIESATGKNYTFAFLGVTGGYSPSANTITFSLANESVGDMVTLLVKAATGQNITLPEPWSALNEVELNDFELVFKAPPSGNKTVELSCDIGLNLEIAKIESFGLLYDCTTRNVKVQMTGTFLGLPMESNPAFQKWNANDPSTAPSVPGKGKNYFELNLLGLGQHIELSPSPDTMQQALAELRGLFNEPGVPQDLTYSQQAGWLITTQFTVLDMIEIGILFDDPNMYGLLITVSKGNFQGLEFEVLYKRINANVGVFYVEFSLPNYLRHLQFGAVSVTLPDLGVWIYTNGGFKIDVGFPYNDNFSQSGGAQVFPFVGAGGFYFGVLHGETDPQLPTITAPQGGNFNPVIEFGIGLQLGLGKGINRGPVTAEIKIAVEGILEGTLAPYHPYNPDIHDSGTENFYYYLQAQIGIVGVVRGAVNLAIITASLSLVAKVIATAIIEAHRAIELGLTASATIEVTVTINLWLFSIHIHLHFDFSVSEHFTLGHNTLGPWDAGYVGAAPRWSITAFQATLPPPAPMNWQAPAPVVPPQSMELYFVPKFTVTAATAWEVQMEAMLLVDAPSASNPTADTSFNRLSEALLLWTFNALIDPTKPLDDILDQEVTLDGILGLQAYIEAQDDGVPMETITPDDLEFFFKNYMDVEIHSGASMVPPAGGTFSAFPMLPYLEMATPAKTVDFSQPSCDGNYFRQIRAAFEGWA